MNFRRSAFLSMMSVGLMASTMVYWPVHAEEGELIAKEAKAQINVRSLANTQADILAAGSVGDQVEILEHSVGNDGLIWYKVKLLKSGHSGWIRGDFVKISGNPTPKAAATGPSKSHPKQSSQSKSSSAVSKSTATPPPIALTPPKPPASAKSAAATKPPAPKTVATKPPATKSVSTKTVADSSSPSPEPDSATAKPSPEPTPNAVSSDSITIVAFETPTYAVRVFSQSGQLRLNVFNRKTQAMALEAVPVQSKSSSEGTTYSYQTEVKVTVAVPTSGQPTVSTSSLGETIKERSEAAESSPAPSSEPSVTPSPEPSPKAPAPTTPTSEPSPAATPAPQP